MALELYVFGPAEKALGDPARSEFREGLTKLAQAGVPVHVCRSIAEDTGKADEFRCLGFTWNTRAMHSPAMRRRLLLSSASEGWSMYGPAGGRAAVQFAGGESGEFRGRRFQIGREHHQASGLLTLWDWLPGPLAAAVALTFCGWWMARDTKEKTLWSSIKAP